MLRSCTAGSNPFLRYKLLDVFDPPELARPSAGFAEAEDFEAVQAAVFEADRLSDLELAELLEAERAGVNPFTITLPLISGDSRPAA